MSKEPLIPQDVAANAIDRALRLRVGRGRMYSFSGLSDATGIPTRTLESYVQGSTPGLGALLSLCSILGPSFTSDVLNPTGQSAHAHSTDEPEHVRVITMLGALTAEIGTAMEDGHIDHQEKARLRQSAQTLMEKLQPLTQDEATIQFRGKVT